VGSKTFHFSNGNCQIASGYFTVNIGTAAGPTFYYLSLGDSLAYGIDVPRMLDEVAAGKFDATTFNQGYTDLIASRLRSGRNSSSATPTSAI